MKFDPKNRTEGWMMMSWNDIFAKKKTEENSESYAAPSQATDSFTGDGTRNDERTGTEKISEIPETKNYERTDGADSVLCGTTIRMSLKGPGDAGKAAVYLALSSDIAEECRIKDALTSCGWYSVATEVGGISGELSLKVSRALVGAALNSGVVRKNTSEMHSLMHAAQEAFSSFIPTGLLEASVGAKIAIVRNSQWIAVAVAGDTAFHASAHHERIGVGVMHI